MVRKRTFQLVLFALFAALTAILSQISVPIGPVPINLATFSVFLAGGILGASGGAVSMAVYVLLGAVGVPVFAGFSSGVGTIAGPTGGYIIGYIAAAWLVGLLAEKFGGKTVPLAFSMVAGLAVCYFLGTAWFMLELGKTLWAALTVCVFPFLIGDALKIAAAAVLVPRLVKIIHQMPAAEA